jgi:hypothetical protein
MENYHEWAIDILGPLTSTAHVIWCSDKQTDPVSGKLYEYEYDGSIVLPSDSARLIMIMAKFCQASLANPPSINGLDLKEYPKETFNLRSLLTAAYPRHPETEVFKGDNVGIYVLVGGNELEAEESFFVAFGGVGVILMKKLRMMLGESRTDEEILALCTDRYLVFDSGEKE